MTRVGSAIFHIVLATIAVVSNTLELQQSTNRDRTGSRSHPASLVVKGTTIPQQLVICNAYTSEVPLQIVQVRTQQILNPHGYLAYKQCGEFAVPLEDGDQLDFKAGRLDIGTFFATGLPQYKSTLVLVARRRKFGSVGLGFESHAFADLANPQIAVIDTYHGKNTGVVKISETVPITDDKEGGGLTLIEDELKFSSVVAVNAGKYQVALMGNGTENMTKVSLNAVGKGKYVVMRIGSESIPSRAGYYPQELIVFPSSAISMSLSVIATILAVYSIGRFF